VLEDLFVVHEIPATPLASAGIITVHLVVTLIGANNKRKVMSKYKMHTTSKVIRGIQISKFDLSY
jgi:hypothetical protein